MKLEELRDVGEKYLKGFHFLIRRDDMVAAHFGYDSYWEEQVKILVGDGNSALESDKREGLEFTPELVTSNNNPCWAVAIKEKVESIQQLLD